MRSATERPPVDGPLVTLAVAAGVFVLWLLLQILAGIVVLGIYGTTPPFGFATTLVLLASGPPAWLALLLWTRWREGSLVTRLGFRFEASAWKPTLLWTGITVVTVAAGEALRLALGKPAVPEFLEQAWATSGPVPLFLIAFVLLPPLFEETLFRGWMIPGLAGSRLGTAGAVVVSSILFAAVHLQYDWIDMAVVFAMGLALGGTRVATDSVLPPMVLHGLINGAAVVQVAVVP